MGVPHNKLPPGVAASNTVWYSYRKHAKLIRVNFRLTRHNFDRMLQLPCHYCGTSPSNVAKGSWGNGEFTYNGIDRKNSAKDYIGQNVVPCCIICNRMKHRLGYKQFLRQIKRIFKFKRLK